MSSAPILDNKNPGAPSVFEPAALLREARRQKGMAATDVPSVCVLDPDGDIVRTSRAAGRHGPLRHGPAIIPFFTTSPWPAEASELSVAPSARLMQCWSRKNFLLADASC